MASSDISSKVRRLEILTRRIVNQRLAGQYHSVFKGQGMDFNEVRPYTPGDDVRFLDWNVSARTGDLHIKRFVEERQLTVVIAVDVSSSMQFGSREQSKVSLATELALVLALSAIRNDDRVGLLIFDEEVVRYIPAKKGKKHVLRLVTEIEENRGRRGGTDVAGALEYLVRVLRRAAVVFVISDFLTDDVEGLQRSLKIAARRHDVVPMIFEDRRERELPAIGGLLDFVDLEDGQRACADLGSERRVARFAEEIETKRAERDHLLKRLKLDAVEIEPGEPYIDSLATFFRKRANRY